MLNEATLSIACIAVLHVTNKYTGGKVKVAEQALPALYHLRMLVDVEQGRLRAAASSKNSRRVTESSEMWKEFSEP